MEVLGCWGQRACDWEVLGRHSSSSNLHRNSEPAGGRPSGDEREAGAERETRNYNIRTASVGYQGWAENSCFHIDVT